MAAGKLPGVQPVLSFNRYIPVANTHIRIQRLSGLHRTIRYNPDALPGFSITGGTRCNAQPDKQGGQEYVQLVYGQDFRLPLLLFSRNIPEYCFLRWV